MSPTVSVPGRPVPFSLPRRVLAALALALALSLAGAAPASPAAALTPTITATPAPGGPTFTPTPSPAAGTLPDLIVGAMRAELETGGQCSPPSTSLGVRVTIRNQGNAPTGSPFDVTINTAFRRVTQSLAPGETTSLWVPGVVAFGQNVATVDVNNEIPESNEGNNQRSEQLPIPTLPPTCTPGGPTFTPTATPTPGTPTVSPTPTFFINDVDLDISGFQITLEHPGCLVVGDPLGIRVTVRNSYSGTAGPFDVDVNGVRQRVPGLGGKTTISLWFPGYRVGENVAIADAGREIFEVREDNNERREVLAVPTPPRPCTPTATPAGGTLTPTPTAVPTDTPAPTFTATATATATPAPVPGARADGFGIVRTGRGRALFFFAVRRSGAAGEVSGQLFYANFGSGLTVLSEAVTSLTVEGNSASFGGTCSGGAADAPCTFTVKVVDGGPGAGGDSLSIAVPGEGTETGRVVSGDVRVSGVSSFD